MSVHFFRLLTQLYDEAASNERRAGLMEFICMSLRGETITVEHLQQLPQD